MSALLRTKKSRPPPGERRPGLPGLGGDPLLPTLPGDGLQRFECAFLRVHIAPRESHRPGTNLLRIATTSRRGHQRINAAIMADSIADLILHAATGRTAGTSAGGRARPPGSSDRRRRRRAPTVRRLGMIPSRRWGSPQPPCEADDPYW